MDTQADRIADAVRRLVDEYRDSCLWFLRPTYYPEGREETLRILAYIERALRRS